MKKSRCIFLLLFAVFLTACGAAGKVIKSDLSRNTSPVVADADRLVLVKGNSEFAFNFYHHVRTGDQNIVFSPYSISMAFAMLYGGAKTDTAAQMADSLHFTLPENQFHTAFNELSLNLEKRPAQSKEIDRENPMEMSIANAIWGQEGYPFEESYLDLLAVNYGAGIREVDFAGDNKSACEQINNWVDQETKGKIKNVVAPESIDPTTRLVLTNAIYFKAAWKEAFVKEETTDASFTLIDGTQVMVPTMKTDGNIPVKLYSGEGFQALSLPYKGDLAEMVILLPDEGNFVSFEEGLDYAGFSEILSQMNSSSLTLYMPRFEFESAFDLKPALSAMGMPLVFDENQADFSGISTAERLYAQQAIHKAYILANEEGTEAAAVTILMVAPTSLEVAQELHIDHPFIFVIRDIPTGTILFVGRVMNPLES